MFEFKDEEQKNTYASVFASLNQFERFKEFVDINFKLERHENEETGEFYWAVNERSPAEIAALLQAKMAEKAKKVGKKNVKLHGADVLKKLEEINPELVKK